MTDARKSQECIFSIDVEDWFHILALPTTPDVAQWATLPGYVEGNFRRWLELFRQNDVSVTCFFLGWVAERYPQLVKEAAALGHEVASHGYSHRLTYTLTPQSFLEDIRKAKDILENIVAEPVRGYRCPGFSVTDETPWFFEKLIEAGYSYDSSVFPAPRQHGGLRTDNLAPYLVSTASGSVAEFPVTVARVFGKPMCFFGGGYLRLFPYPVTRAMGQRVLDEGRPIVFYVHPREIDPSHPRLPMGLARRFRSYVGLSTTEGKVKRIFDDFDVTTFRDYMTDHELARATAS